MNTKERLIKVFRTVFEDEFDAAALSESASLLEDLGMNSIGLLYMAMATEEEFGIKFQNEDFGKLRTVGDVIACVESKL
jgi:acyl carrier protein